MCLIGVINAAIQVASKLGGPSVLGVGDLFAISRDQNPATFLSYGKPCRVTSRENQ